MTEQTHTDVQPIYSQSDRRVQNAIAEAILSGQVVERGPELKSFYSYSDAPQPAGDELSSAMVDAGRSMYYAALDVVRAVKAGQGTASSVGRFSAAERMYDRLSTAYHNRRPGREGVLRDGSSKYRVDHDGAVQFFTLDLLETGEAGLERLSVLNGQDLENRAGFAAGEGAWRALAAWVSSYDRARGGRPQAVREAVWRDDRGTLILRSYIPRDYLLLPRALHCIGLTLRSKVDEATPTEAFSQAAEDIADWAETQDAYQDWLERSEAEDLVLESIWGGRARSRKK